MGRINRRGSKLSIAFSQAILEILLQTEKYTQEQIVLWADVDKDFLREVEEGTQPFTTLQVISIEKGCGKSITELVMNLCKNNIQTKEEQMRYDAVKQILNISKDLNEQLRRDYEK